MFRATEPVRAGALVVTDGSRYPPGLVVGAVTTTADAEVGFVLRTQVDPAARLSEIDYVKVIVGFSPIDAGLEDGAADLGTPNGSAATGDR